MVKKISIRECSQLETHDIPNDWNCEKLGLNFELKAGSTPRRSNSKFFQGEIPWVTSSDLNRDIILDTLEKISMDAVKQTNLEIFPKDNFVIALYGLEAEGTRGNCGILKIDAAINQACMTFFEIGDIESKYLFYFYLLYGNKIALKFAQGTKQQNLYKETLKNIVIHYPERTEQRKIIQILANINYTIGKLDELIKKKKNIKQGAMQELLTGKKRLEGFTGDWEVSNFGDIIDYTKGFAFKSKDYVKNGVRIIRVSDTTFSSIKNENPIFIEKNHAKQFRNWELLEDDLVFSTVGSKPPMYDSLVGRAIIIDRKHQGCLLNQNAVIIRIKNKTKLKQILLLNHFLTKRYLRFIEKIYRGNANQASITLKDLFKFSIPFPKNQNEQNAIAKILSYMDLEIEQLETKKEKYVMIKNGMMQKLLTGEIRII